jgi:hypothetical protein
LADRRWYWRVRALDAAGNTGAWSAVFNVFINAIPTPIPTLLDPADGLLTRETVFTFDWSDEPDVRRYNIQVDNENTFTAPYRINANPAASEFRNGALPLGNGVWYWRVRAQGTDSLWGEFSGYRTILVDRVKPARVVLASPPTGQPTHDNPPTFTWNAVPDADVIAYLIQIDKNNLFNSAEKLQQQVTGTAYTPGAPLADRKWFWRVQAVDAVGNTGPWSAIWTVMVDTTAAPTGQVIESDSPVVVREGQWQQTQAARASGGSYLASRGQPASLSLTFTGSQIEVVYGKHATLGTFALEVDGQVVRKVNSRTPNAMTLARVTVPVTPGEHTLRIVSVKGSVVIDAFTITP